MSQHLAFAEKMLVGTRGKLNVDPSCISTGELSAKKEKKKGIGSRIHNIMSKMCRIQCPITQLTGNSENLSILIWKGKLTDVNPGILQMLD